MNRSIRFGLIGLGPIGAYHLSTIEALQCEGTAEIVAVVDPALQRQPELEASLKARGIRCYLDYQEMLCLDDIDAVSIATPIPYHHEMTQACLERGVYVYLEKPPVPLIQQLEELISADPYHRVSVGYQMILSNCLLRLKQAVLDGKLGEIQEITAGGCWPRQDAYYRRANWAGKLVLDDNAVFDGPATNGMAHVIHNIMFLAGQTPSEFASPVEIRGELYRARPIESYDIASLRGVFPSGLRFSATLTHATEEELPFSVEIRGTKGWGRISNDGNRYDSSFGDSMVCSESTLDLLKKTFREFIEYCNGQRERVSTRLSDTRGYLLATNGMLLSSGGIHDVSPEYIRCYSRGDDSGFDVPGLSQAVEQSIKTGCLLSELGMPWAVPTPAIDVQHVTNISLQDLKVSPKPLSVSGVV